ELDALEARFKALIGDLEDLLHGVSLVREASPRTLDAILSHGERLSAPVVAAAMRAAGLPATDCDTRPLVVTDAGFGSAHVDVEATNERLRDFFRDLETVPVLTGFIAATREGETTTLGRGGSDYTASLVGAGVGAEAVEIWTDVDGVMSADPRLVPTARPISRLSYIELMELSHFGAKVIYPPSVHPTRRAGIPLWIRNTFNPSAPGTLVDAGPAAQEPLEPHANPVRGIASIRRIALLRLEGDGMVGVPGIAMRLFGALAREKVNVVLISQASSEHSICFGIAPEAVNVAARSLAEEFALERQAGLIDELIVEDDVSVVAAVGTGMRERPGIARAIFGALADRGISVRAIAQGSSELNVSLVVPARDEQRAVVALHERFFARLRPVEIHLAGVGRVGRALLAQVAAGAAEIARRRGLELNLTAVADSRGVFAPEGALDPATAAAELAAAPHLEPLEIHLRRVAARAGRSVFVDCTSSDEVGAAYGPLLAAGVPVVSANKRPFAATWAEWPQVGPVYHEATVGAGLPVVGVLRDLIASGDRLLRVEGVLSGTLGFLLHRLRTGHRFSAALREAYDLGLTEPDPREDLSGGDVGRKLLILARLAGYPLEPADVHVEPLLPADAGWEKHELADFWHRVPELDPVFAARVEAAAGRPLAYLARFDGETARVGLEVIDGSHPAAALEGTENLVVLTTERYHHEPISVRGPGAGPDVTAAGVFADLLRAAGEWRPL
ncbi:MAG: bifunctional aspartate kinase/homoserine dehydrogenase I, partial [Acidobacteria bacterium]|nr:bifunctional aspartate kinase/homoserine dehydrogenase I [Acidobacteriota bacterium]